MNHASVNSSLGGAGRFSEETPSTRGTSGSANAAAWLLVVAFVGLVLSVVVPAMSDGADAGLAAALLFMLGMAATLLGSGLAVAASTVKSRALFGAVVMLAGLVLMYGIVPSLAALGVVLVGAALQIGSLPGDD